MDYTIEAIHQATSSFLINRELIDKLMNSELSKRVVFEMQLELKNQFGRNFFPEFRSERDNEEIFLRELSILVDEPDYVEIGRKIGPDKKSYILVGKGYDFSFNGMKERFKKEWEELYTTHKRFMDLLEMKKLKLPAIVRTPTLRRMPINESNISDSYGTITLFNSYLYNMLE